MKLHPIKKVEAPAYPTLMQVKRETTGTTVCKVAAVAAVAAAMTLAAGCGEETNRKHIHTSIFQKGYERLTTEETYELAGDTTVETDQTEPPLMGEAVPYYTEDEYLAGDEIVETEPACTDDDILSGGVEVVVDEG